MRVELKVINYELAVLLYEVDSEGRESLVSCSSVALEHLSRAMSEATKIFSTESL